MIIGGIIGLTLYMMLMAWYPTQTLIGTGIVIVVWLGGHWITSHLMIRKQRRW